MCAPVQAAPPSPDRASKAIVAGELAEPTSIPVELVVDTSRLDPPVDERLEVELESHLTRALDRHGFTVVSGGSKSVIEASVDLSSDDNLRYTISVDLIIDGTHEEIVNRAVCMACSEEEVVEQAVELLAWVEGRLRELRPPAPTIDGTPTDERRGLRLGGLGLTGTIALSAGAVTAGAGALIMFLATPVDAPDSYDSSKAEQVGLTLVIAGTAAAAAGLTALAIDATVLERCCRRNELRVSTLAGPRGAMLSLTGRF